MDGRPVALAVAVRRPDQDVVLTVPELKRDTFRVWPAGTWLYRLRENTSSVVPDAQTVGKAEMESQRPGLRRGDNTMVVINTLVIPDAVAGRKRGSFTPVAVMELSPGNLGTTGEGLLALEVGFYTGFPGIVIERLRHVPTVPTDRLPGAHGQRVQPQLIGGLTTPRLVLPDLFTSLA